MHIAVDQGAAPNESFATLSAFLMEQGTLGKPFDQLVERIRRDGNAENHQIRLSTNDEAVATLRLVTFVLRSIYEIPSLLPADGE